MLTGILDTVIYTDAPLIRALVPLTLFTLPPTYPPKNPNTPPMHVKAFHSFPLMQKKKEGKVVRDDRIRLNVAAEDGESGRITR